MKTAPGVFSSNFADEDLANKRDAIFDVEYIFNDTIEVDDDNHTSIKTTEEITYITIAISDEDHEEGHCAINNYSPNCKKDEINEIVDSTLQRRRPHKKKD